MPKRDRRETLISYLLVRQDYTCYRCHAAVDADVDALDIDHIERLADGGTDDTCNKCLVHTKCHRAKTALENSGGAAVTRDQAIRERLRRIQMRKPQQNHHTFSLDQLRDLWTSGKLVIAPLNRAPVWDERKQRAYVLTVMEGRITPPFFWNNVRHKDVYHIYDGVNRITALMRFMDGALHVCLPNEARPATKLTYAPCCVFGCKRDCFEMVDNERRNFRLVMLDVFQWDDLPEHEACEIAQNINSGTPMSIGERIKLLCGFDTPRARALKSLYESEAFAVIKKNNREAELKALAIVLRSMIDPSFKCTSTLTNNYQVLQTFYASAVAVDRVVLQQAGEHLTRIARLLEPREKTTHNLMVAHFGLRTPGCDVESALADGASHISPEDLVLKWTTTTTTP